MSFETSQQAVVRLTLGLTEKFKKHISQQEKLAKNRVKNKKYYKNNISEDKFDESLKYQSFESVFIQEKSLKTNILIDRYELKSFIGAGAFSCCILAVDKLRPDQPFRVIKKMNQTYEEFGLQEYRLLKRIHRLPYLQPFNPPIIKAFSMFIENECFHLVLEALDPLPIKLGRCMHLSTSGDPLHSPLACHIRHKTLRKIAKQILISLNILHNRANIIHADLKPENILRCYSDNPRSVKLKIIDFGNAIPLEAVEAYYVDFDLQSVYYRAPEVLLGLPFGPSIDIFSLGLILVELLFDSDELKKNSRPFLSTVETSRTSLAIEIARLLGKYPPRFKNAKFWKNDYYNIEINTSYLLKNRLRECNNPLLEDFIIKLLAIDDTERLTSKTALNHLWLFSDHYDLMHCSPIIKIDHVEPFSEKAFSIHNNEEIDIDYTNLSENHIFDDIYYKEKYKNTQDTNSFRTNEKSFIKENSTTPIKKPYCLDSWTINPTLEENQDEVLLI